MAFYLDIEAWGLPVGGLGCTRLPVMIFKKPNRLTTTVSDQKYFDIMIGALQLLLDSHKAHGPPLGQAILYISPVDVLALY